MKKILLFLSVFFFLAACSSNDVSPNDAFNSYMTKWSEGKYDELYELFSTEAKSAYTVEESVERNKKIYNSLQVEITSFTFDELTKDDVKKAFDEGVTTIPYHVEMDTIAGPITFDYVATLQLEGEEDEENWYIAWDPGFIFPEIKDGGNVRYDIIEPKRGEILDRNQMPLALNDEIYEINIVPGKLENQEKSIKEIAKILGIDEEYIETQLNQEWVQPDLAVPISKIMKDNESVKNRLLQISGVQINTKPGRVYPSGEATAHLTGYLRPIRADDFEEFDEADYDSGDMIGARGLERLFEEQLKGEEGAIIYVEKEDEEDIVIAEKKVQHGKNIVLTIDINLQEEMFESYGSDAGTAAAIDAKTGEVLALVSSPGFDPNEVMYGTTAGYMEKLDKDEQLPLINRVVSTYAPGSVFKPITAAIGLKNGTIKADEGIEIKGLQWGKKSWGDYKVTRVSTSSAPVDLKDALVRSDNIYFAMKAVEMGKDSFTEGLHNFGIGKEFPLSYPITESTISNSGELDTEVMIADTSYGQGQILMSAAHIATTYTTFLNDGNMLKPTFLAEEETGQIWQENLITKEEAEIIQDALRAVVTKGTGKAAKIDELAISGKTGTVELKQNLDEKGAENSWFVGYPTDSKDIIIAMMVENTHRSETEKPINKVTDLLLKWNNDFQ